MCLTDWMKCFGAKSISVFKALCKYQGPPSIIIHSDHPVRGVSATGQLILQFAKGRNPNHKPLLAGHLLIKKKKVLHPYYQYVSTKVWYFPLTRPISRTSLDSELLSSNTIKLYVINT